MPEGSTDTSGHSVSFFQLNQYRNERELGLMSRRDIEEIYTINFAFLRIP